MNSLRRAIITPISVLLSVFCLFATAASFGFVTYEANKFLDSQLQEIAINVAPDENSPKESLLETEDEDRVVVRVWDHSGTIVYRGGPQIEIPWVSQPGLADVVADGQTWRVYRWSNTERNVQIAQTWSARREIATYAATGAALPLLLMIPIAWILIRRSIGRTLQGFHRLSSDIGHRSLDAREPVRPGSIPLEIAPLITAIDELIDRYRQALETQRRFIADAAHELRTPLAALQIQAENLLASDLSGPSQELANEIGDGVRRSSQLASQLLNMATTEGPPVSNHRAVDLGILATEVLADFITLTNVSRVRLERVIVDPISIVGDESAIRKLLSILIDNAIRYSARDGLVTVQLSLTDEQYPQIDVVDNGQGIPDDALPFIYDRFFRAAPQVIEGTGLGLAIARAIAERNGIQLRHRNRADKSGAIATIIFERHVAKVTIPFKN